MTRRLSFVAEITVVIDANGTQQTFYFGTEGWATRGADTPADTLVQPLLADAGSYRQELFSGARVTGASRPSFGQLVLNNADGALDGWLGYGVSAGLVTVRMGDTADAYPSAWTTVYVAYAYALVVDFSEVRVLLRDRTWLLDKPVVTDVFGAVTGFEATTSARKKQMVFGWPGYIPPILLNGPKQIYFVQANATSHRVFNPTPPEFTAFDGGVALTFGGYYETAEEGVSDDGAPDPGEFKVYADGVDPDTMESTGPLFLRLGSPPEYDVRYNPRGLLKNGTNDSARTWTFLDLCQRAGLTDVTADTLAAGSMIRTVGNFLCDGDQTYLQVMDDVANAYFTPYGFDRLDQFFTYNLQLGGDGDDASVYTFTVHNAKGFRRLPVPGMEAPVWQFHARAGRTWPSSVATSLEDAAEREAFTRDIATIFTASSQSARTANPGAETGYVEIVGREFDDLAERQWFAARYFHLFGARRDLLMVTARLDASTIGINLHDKVTVQMPRLGCDAGRLFRVITAELNLRERTATFGLWGGDAGPTDWVIGDDSIGGGSGASDFNPYLKSIGDFYFVGGRAAVTVGGPTGYTSKSIGEFTLAGAITNTASADPYWEDVLLLLKMEGSGDTLLDSSKYARTVTTNTAGSLTVPITQGSGAFTGFPSVQVEINASPDNPTDWVVSHASDFQVPVMTIEYFWYQTSSSNHTTAPAHIYMPGVWYQGTYSNSEEFTYRWGGETPGLLGAGSLTYSTNHHIATVFDADANTIEVWMDGTRIVNLTGLVVGTAFGFTDIYIGDMTTGSTTEAATYQTSQVRATAARRYSGATITVPDGPFPDATSGIPPYGGTWTPDYEFGVSAYRFILDTHELGTVTTDLTDVTVTANGTIPGMRFEVEYGGGGGTVDRIVMTGIAINSGAYAITLTFTVTATGAFIDSRLFYITIE